MKKALFTVSYAGLWGQEYLDPVACIYKAASLGFDGIFFMGKRPHLFPFDVDTHLLDRIHTSLDETGLVALGIAGYNDFLVSGPAEVPLLDMQLAYVEACCRLAQELGAPLVRLFTGYLSASKQSGKTWPEMVAILRTCGEVASRYNVTIVVQNHHDFAVDTNEMHQLLTEVDHPAVKAGYDAWSPFLRGEDLAQGARYMGSMTALTIAANYSLFPRYSYHPDQVNYQRVYPDTVRATAMSTGAIDYTPFFTGLLEGGYQGWVVYEMCSPLKGGGSEMNLDAHATDFVRWMDTHFSE